MRPLFVVLALANCAHAQSCDHPYAPVHPGWTWVYRLGSTNFELQRRPDGEGSFTETSTSPNAPGTRRYTCEQGAQLPVAAEIKVPGVDVRVTGARGVAVLPASQWQVGAIWRYSLTLSAALQGPLPLSGPGELSVTFRIVDRQQISVPAGTFDTFKVEVSREMQGKLGLFPFQRAVRQVSYYAAGVGVVREETEKGVIELAELRKP